MVENFLELLRSTKKQLSSKQATKLNFYLSCKYRFFIDKDRSRAARTLQEKHDCDVIISDDGLQHYKMDRKVEIAVIDGARRLGNGMAFPAGPLREPKGRLKEVDFIVNNGGPTEAGRNSYDP